MDVWDDGQHQHPESARNLGQEDPTQAEAEGGSNFAKGNLWQQKHSAELDSPLHMESWATPSASDVWNSTEADSPPEGFDWQTYLTYYPDLVQSGINSEGRALQHYLQHGRREGRLYRRLKVLLHYTACTGETLQPSLRQR